MKKALFQTPQYHTLIQKHISEMIEYLFSQNQYFAVACEIKHTTFTPPLPSEIQNSFNQTVLFVLSGYTFESAILNEGFFSFEAGFGADNFGSTVSVPLLAIKQIFVEESPVILNFAEIPKTLSKPTKSTISKNSMEALLKNPKNKKLLKKH